MVNPDMVSGVQRGWVAQPSSLSLALSLCDVPLTIIRFHRWPFDSNNIITGWRVGGGRGEGQNPWPPLFAPLAAQPHRNCGIIRKCSNCSDDGDSSERAARISGRTVDASRSEQERGHHPSFRLSHVRNTHVCIADAGDQNSSILIPTWTLPIE